MIKAILFDMDGTLIDSMSLWAQAFNEYLEPYNKTVDFSKGKYGGSPIEYILKDIFKDTKITKLDSLEQNILQRAKELLVKKQIPFLPGAKEFVEKQCKTKKCAICSGSSLEIIHSIMQSHNFSDRFQTVVSAQEVPRGKPAPDIWLEAARRLDVKPEECLVIEDAVSGMIGAKEAGMKVIGVVREKSDIFPADELYTSFTQITDISF